MKTKVRGRDGLSPKQDAAAESILQCIAEWIDVLAMERWDLTVTFSTSYKDGESEKDSTCTWADTDTSWCYQTIHMTFYPRAVDPKKITDEDIEHMIVHELGHSLVRPMVAEEVTDREQEREEFVVTNLERVLVGLKYREIR